MKAIRLTIKNVGLIESETIELNKPLILFYGDIKQGKTTILNAVRLLFGGAFPSDVIRHGATEAGVKLELDCGSITREFYRGSDGEIKGRPIAYLRDGKKIERPVEALAKLLNPFLLDQNFLVNKTELERKRFFTELFGVDTSDIDRQIAQSENDAKELRATLRAYGDIDLTPVEKVDVEKLRDDLQQLRTAYDQEAAAVTGRNNEVREHNNLVDANATTLKQWQDEVLKLEGLLANAKKQAELVGAWVQQNPKREVEALPARPDTTELERKISDGAAQNVRHELYCQNVARDHKRREEQARVSALEQEQKNLKARKLARLQDISERCGVPGLVFNAEGEFSYEGTQAGMLSTSQLMKLSSALSSLYPEGLGIDLIDRAESLGSSVFELVDRAKKEDKTILATVVGERPAKVPEHVGVFVVSNGKIT